MKAVTGCVSGGVSENINQSGQKPKYNNNNNSRIESNNSVVMETEKSGGGNELINELDMYNTPTEILSCGRCVGLYKRIGVATTFTFDKALGTSGPIIHKVFTEPHVCTLGRLKDVEMMYRGKQIGKELYDKWMTVNGGSYQLGECRQTMELWKEAGQTISRPAYSEREGDRLSNVGFSRGGPVSLVKCRRHGGMSVRINWNRVASRNDVKCLNRIWKWSSPADKDKSSIDVATLVLYVARSGFSERVNKVLPYLDTTYSNVTAAAVIIHSIGNPEIDMMLGIYGHYKACCLGREGYATFHKAVSVAIRRTGKTHEGHVASLQSIASIAGWELATGRSHNHADWVEERDMRTKKHAWLRPGDEVCALTEESNDRYLERLRPIMEEIFNEWDIRASDWTSWPDFVESRQEWVSSGSAAGAKLVVDGDQVRVNKRTYFDNLADSEILSWIDTEPRIEAVASDKFESGKSRAIYGTKPIDYAIMTYVIQKAEIKLSSICGVESGLIGLDEIAGILRRQNVSGRDGVESTCLDYADFNYQHTLKAQALIFTCLQDRMRLLGAHEDAIRAAAWCSSACLNQWATFPGQGGAERITQGMFSGVRGTNFMNTVLNVAYFREARRSVSRSLALEPVDLYNLHQGDDVWITHSARIWGIALYTYMQASGFVFQDSKQMFDINRGEFLRVIYGHGEARGYLARAVATLIIKPIQGVQELSPQEKITALNSHIHVLYRRGLLTDACKLLWDAIIPFWAALCTPKGGIDIPMGIVMKAYELGGLDLGAPATLPEGGTPTAAIPNVAVDSGRVAEASSSHMAKAWVRVISKQYHDTFDAPAVEDALHRQNAGDSTTAADRMRALKRLGFELEAWRSALADKSGRRSYEAYSSCLSTLESHPMAERELWPLKERLWSKRGFMKRTRIDAIMSAISSSPFKDINTAMRALNLGRIAAARVCLSLGRNSSLASLAAGVVSNIQENCGDAVLSRILSGVRGVGPSFESILHPIVLSWCVKMGSDYAMLEAARLKVSSVAEWDDLLKLWIMRFVSTVIVDGTLVAISKY